ncbi:UDP-glucuronosyltransferase 2B1 [Eumeta japonica]|uniref:UDP-glucuronosyltransferase 2B1 n=1 Tax=Eumeta variegata TaxID=151549 RepID=A0A4C1U5J6_EUMVA|nr:UDP-glucuronosyltransferase 2B1 [Eumeta japonica]
MDQAVHQGYGIKVDYQEDLAKPLKSALDKMLNKPSYTEKAKRMSAIFHDLIASPRQELVHWVEHVVRTQGAPHLRSIALHVPWYQKMYLDLMVITAVLLYIVKNILCWTTDISGAGGAYARDVIQSYLRADRSLPRLTGAPSQGAGALGGARGQDTWRAAPALARAYDAWCQKCTSTTK